MLLARARAPGEPQLKIFRPGIPALKAVAERLAELERAVAEWDPARRAEPEYRSLVTPEHQTRKWLCWFVDLDGASRLFDLHARFTPGAGRLHFRLEGAARSAVVAHVGEKL
jgi:hypothetical protein